MFKDSTTFSEVVGATAFGIAVIVLAAGSFLFEGELRSTAVNACQGLALVGIGYFLRSKREQAGANGDDGTGSGGVTVEPPVTVRRATN